jgi:hypothetical protein
VEGRGVGVLGVRGLELGYWYRGAGVNSRSSGKKSREIERNFSKYAFGISLAFLKWPPNIGKKHARSWSETLAGANVHSLGRRRGRLEKQKRNRCDS